MGAGQLPMDLLHWLISLVPIAVLMILLLGRGWKGIEAGPLPCSWQQGA